LILATDPARANSASLTVGALERRLLKKLKN
jgi:hypothetical protein